MPMFTYAAHRASRHVHEREGPLRVLLGDAAAPLDTNHLERALRAIPMRLVKFNRKTVTVLTDDNRQWRVPPEILSPIRGVEPGTSVVPDDDNRSE